VGWIGKVSLDGTEGGSGAHEGRSSTALAWTATGQVQKAAGSGQLAATTTISSSSLIFLITVFYFPK